jgi:hypothetical protein
LINANEAAQKANKAKIDGYVDRMTKSVNNTMAKNPLDFLQSKVFTLGTQTELANVIDTGDTKVERDAKEEAVIKNVTDLIKMDSLEIWTDYMESLKELTTEEYAEAVGITVEQAEGHVEKLDKVDVACAASALSTLKLGAQSGMPTASEVSEYLLSSAN